MVLQTILRNISTKTLRPITSCRHVQNVFNRTFFATSNRFHSESATTPLEPTFEEHIANSIDSAEPIGTIAEPTFEELLANSKLMKFGRCEDKCVIGKIVDICNDDLYIDFGGKFEFVAQRPESDDPEYYKKGKFVRIILFNYEMTGKFLGDDTNITVCEANGVLVGPLYNNKPVFVRS